MFKTLLKRRTKLLFKFVRCIVERDFHIERILALLGTCKVNVFLHQVLCLLLAQPVGVRLLAPPADKVLVHAAAFGGVGRVQLVCGGVLGSAQFVVHRVPIVLVGPLAGYRNLVRANHGLRVDITLCECARVGERRETRVIPYVFG